jgi:hypothetical protein
MQQYKTFSFDAVTCAPEEGRIELRYSLRDAEDGGFGMIEFVEKLEFPAIDHMPTHRHKELERALFLLHMIGGISYYKTCLPAHIDIHSGQLTAEEALHWKTVYENGLGEFFYKNKIDFRGRIEFPAAQNTNPSTQEPPTRAAQPIGIRRCLVPIGGGKDSIVTIELLKAEGLRPTLLRIGSHPLITAQARTAGLELVDVKRSLSPHLFELNAQGALNGHVPITAYLSFLAVVLAILRDEEAVIFSNERSANEGNVEYLGTTINHQWSKSMECETLLRNLVGSATRVQIFSLLRAYSELHIADIFSSFPQYFAFVTSCNENWKIAAKSTKVGAETLWCGRCPKCAFVFALLHSSLPHSTVVDIFRRDLFADEALLHLFRELLGKENFKPFECVGTAEETAAAFLLAHRRGDAEKTAAMMMFTAEILPGIQNPDALIANVRATSAEHHVPPSLAHCLTT